MEFAQPLEIFPQFIGGFGTAVVAPSGWFEQVFQLLGERDIFLHVFPDRFPFMKHHMPGIAGLFNGFGQSVPHGVRFQFFLEAAKDLIPDDQAHAHIPVEIPRIAGMVYPVVRRAHKHSFEPGRHFADILRMHKYPIGLRDGVHEYDIDGMEAQQGDGNEIDEAVHRLKDGRPETGAEVEFFRRVVCNMHGPEDTAVMIDPVFNIERQVFQYE